MLITNIVIASITHYCACTTVCCPKESRGLTASMVYPIEGLTIAGPRRFPFGSIVILADGRKFIIQDRLAKKYDNRFDIFVHSHKRAKKLGIMQNEKVMVIVNKTTK